MRSIDEIKRGGYVPPDVVKDLEERDAEIKRLSELAQEALRLAHEKPARRYGE